MFDTVLGHTDSRRRVGTGAIISIAFHAAVLTAGVWISARAIAPVSRSLPDVIFRGPMGGGGKRAASKGTQVAPVQAHPRQKHAIVPPTVVPEVPPQPIVDATPTTGVAVGPDGTATKDGDGDANATCTGPNCTGEGPGEGPGPGKGPGIGGGEDPIPMREGMSPLVLLSGPAIQLTTEALAARVQGTVLVKCALTADGLVNSCKVLKSLPFMDDVVVRALQQRHYKPITFEGKPVSVWYIFSIHVTQN